MAYPPNTLSAKLSSQKLPFAPVVYIELPGPLVARHHHEQQQPFRILDPVGDHRLGHRQEGADDLGHIPSGAHIHISRAEHLARAYVLISKHLSSPFEVGWLWADTRRPASLRLGCVAVLLQRVNGFPRREPSKEVGTDAYEEPAAHI